MPKAKVQTASAIAEAVARYKTWDTHRLDLKVGGGAYCVKGGVPQDEAAAWAEQWLAPPATHPHIPDHVWRDRVELLARRLCGPCPVRDACLALTDRRPESEDGWIAGGLAPHQRSAAAEPAEVAR